MMAMFPIFCALVGTFCTNVIWVEAEKVDLHRLHRQKREWIVPPNRLLEGKDYTHDEYVAKIRSDEDLEGKVEYYLSGPAVDMGIFSVDKKTGYVKVHRILDREETAKYDLKGRALFLNGKPAEKDLDLQIIVVDINDNDPQFEVEMIGSVDELSDTETKVIIITATDEDEKDTDNSKIAYRVIQQEPAGELMFKIDRSSGQIQVRMSTLDRETQETYKLIITGTDMNGVGTGARTGTGTVIINILDVNDNVPYLDQQSYESSVEENIRNVEVIRIKTIDKDKPHTENWEAVYTIISGNEAGHFEITTDSKTNEGILKVTKELDFEELNEVNLTVEVKNKASFHKSVVNVLPLKYPINIKVVNIPEAPHFHPAVKVVSISEDHTTIDMKKVIATYTAMDSDTMLTATNVRYVKGEDVDNWLSINEQTAEIRLNKFPDRESKFLIDGTYYAKILCITNDFPPKTVTGTIGIQVQDFNDHCPILTSSVMTVCYGNSVVYVAATDGDKFPNAEPFEFRVVTERTKEKWNVERLNDTSAVLRSQEILWPGKYTVGLDVQDQQAKSCEVQTLRVSVCTCTEEQVCRPNSQISTKVILGGGGVVAVLLGIVLLLLIPVLLLLCHCGSRAAYGNFQAFPFETQQHLMTDHTEGQGEDQDMGMLSFIPVKEDCEGSRKGGAESGSYEDWRKNKSELHEQYLLNQQHVNQFGVASAQKMTSAEAGYSDFIITNTQHYMSVSDSFLSSYYTMKVPGMMMLDDAMNYMLVSEYETCNSVTGSLEDICSHLREDNDLDFLDDLGLQFKTLAEICCGSTIKLEVSPTPKPTKTAKIKVQDDVSGVQSQMTSVSTSSSSSTTKITNTNYAENLSSRGATPPATIGQTLLVQQPTVYLTSTPMYMMEQQHQPTLYLAPGPMPGVQQNNMVLLEKGGINMAQEALFNLGLQQANTGVFLDPRTGGTLLQGTSGRSETQGSVSGTVHVIDRQQVKSTEPVYVVQSSSHSSFNEVKGQSKSIVTLGNASVIPASKQNVPLFAVPNVVHQ